MNFMIVFSTVAPNFIISLQNVVQSLFKSIHKENENEAMYMSLKFCRSSS